MRERWKVSTLGSVCLIKPPKKEARERLSPSDMVSFVPMNDLGIGEKGLMAREDQPLEAVTGSYTYFADGDVLLAKITPCFENGKLGIAGGLTNGVGFGSSEFIVLRPSDSLNAEYLFYFLSQYSFRDAGASVMSGAVGHKRVPKEFIETFPIPLPPLPEQKRIVAILDEAFSGIATAVANTEKNRANAREVFESSLSSVFSRRGDGWVVYRVGDVFQTATGTTPPKSNPDYYGNAVPFVKPPELIGGPIHSANDGLTKEGAVQARVLPERSVLVSCIGNLGKIGINMVPVAFNQQINAILPNEDVALPEFVYYQSLSRLFRDQLGKLASGTTVPIVNKSKFNSLQVVLPEKTAQKVVVDQLREVQTQTQELEAVIQRKGEMLAELKQSLLQKAFSGELTAAP
jgi:type I restriction enzyme S subunit